MSKNIPKLRFKEFVEEYKNISFGNYISFLMYGPRFSGNDYNKNGNIRTIRGTDVSEKYGIKYNQCPIAKLDKNKINKHILKDKDLVMITTADCGLTSVFKKQTMDYIASAYSVKISLLNNISPYFIRYYFQSKYGKEKVNKLTTIGTLPNLAASDIKKIKLNIPTNLEEQEKIASFLTSIDKNIELLNNKKELLEQYTNGVIQQIFSQQIRFKRDDGSSYEDWGNKELGELYSKNDKSPFPVNKIKSENINFEEIVYPFFTSGKNILDTHIFLIEGENLFLSTGGNAQVKYFKGKSSYSSDTFSIKPSNIINGYLLYLFINQKIEYINQNLFQGGGLKHLDKKGLSKIKLNIPTNLEEQKKIANFLQSLSTQIEQVKIEIDETTTYKNGLLQQMFV
jgi:type I restriction enzyme, S subunit